MGYFANGTEGDVYESRYCARCIHRDDNDGCPVMLAHVLHAYEECGSGSNAENILELLIPRKGAFNDQCRLFTPTDTKEADDD